MQEAAEEADAPSVVPWVLVRSVEVETQILVSSEVSNFYNELLRWRIEIFIVQ